MKKFVQKRLEPIAVKMKLQILHVVVIFVLLIYDGVVMSLWADVYISLYQTSHQNGVC